MQNLSTMPARHPVVLGGLVAALIFPIALMSTGIVNQGPDDLPYVVWALAFCLPLLVVVRRPECSLLLLLIPLGIQYVVTDIAMAADSAVLIGLAFLAAKRPWRSCRYWAAGVLLAALIMTVDWTAGAESPRWTAGQLVGTLSIFMTVAGLIAAALMVGTLTRMRQQQARTWRELAASLERDRQHAIDLSTAEERTRIAADMHDILAHSLAVIAIQTDAARLLLREHRDDPADLDAACQAVDAAHEASVVALRDTRQLVGVLNDPAADRAPQPRLEDLGALIERLDSPQQRIRLSTDLELSEIPLSMPAQVAVYRIVQEALTNVIRHAGAGATAQVSLADHEEHLDVAITDDGVITEAGDGQGHGLANMRQRAESVGGELEAGPRPDGGFRVEVRVPFDNAKEPR